jgi:hypothetical protein
VIWVELLPLPFWERAGVRAIFFIESSRNVITNNEPELKV